MRLSLDGKWTLYLCPPESPSINSPENLEKSGISFIEGLVPGNIEDDLVRAGIEDDPYFGVNSVNFRKYEFYDWWYVRKFEAGVEFKKANLVFEGVDCFCEVFLNGRKAAEFDNALISHSIDVSGLLAPAGERDELAVKIISPVNAVRDFPVDVSANAHMPWVFESLWARKPTHCYGWDIAPRLILGGIWKSVRLEVAQETRIKDLFVETLPESDERRARLKVHYSFVTERRTLDGLMFKIRGTCGDSEFSEEAPLRFVHGKIDLAFDSPKLWWPSGYGEANLYKFFFGIFDECGKEIASKNLTLGIRTVELDRTDIDLHGTEGRFEIKINGVPVMAKGANWVPADALHSRDAERMPKILDLFKELDCNIIRCWGGGVYESRSFYDYCDSNGILVWQDFAFACAMYPQNQSFLEKAAKEIEWVVEMLRGHACIILWCGDNECDQVYVDRGGDPNKNLINRKLIPEILYRMDPGRPYLPSSPYISEEVYNAGKTGGPETIYKLAPERHLWGSREFFKLPFYSQSGAKFISEAGWHGCPGLSSLKKFLSSESLCLDPENPEWDVHASNPFGKWSGLKTRNQLLFKQLEEYFTGVPDSLEEFITASQIFQAEAKKFLIENARLSKECRGIIWWNVMDCWPQFSDAVVDYYFNKKLAFHYIKRSQKPFCLMFSEPFRWNCDLTAVNDTLFKVSGKVEAFEAESGKKLISKDFKLQSNEILNLDAVRAPRGESRLFLVKWESDLGDGGNHYVSVNPGLQLERYLKWLPEIAALDDSFSLDDVGK